MHLGFLFWLTLSLRQNLLYIYIYLYKNFHYSNQQENVLLNSKRISSPIPWRWLNQEPFVIEELIRVWICWATSWQPYMYTGMCSLTCLLVLILMHWQQGSDIEWKWEQLSSSAECRIRTQGLWNRISSRPNARWQSTCINHPLIHPSTHTFTHSHKS